METGYKKMATDPECYFCSSSYIKQRKSETMSANDQDLILNVMLLFPQ